MPLESQYLESLEKSSYFSIGIGELLPESEWGVCVCACVRASMHVSEMGARGGRKHTEVLTNDV